MKYRLLGKSKLKVSEIGFGTWGLGGTKHNAVAYGKTSDAESIRALKKAFDLGINFFDTADLYGFGHSETLLGRAFKENRYEVIIASKVGFLDFSGKQSFSPNHIRTRLQKSLTRLQTDYLDVYQLHGPSPAQLKSQPSILNTLLDLKKSGLIRCIGISVQNPKDGLDVIKHFDVDCIQVNFNLSDQRAIENGLFELCKRKKIGVIVRTPLCFGFLTDAPVPRKFIKGDHRSRFSKDQITRWNRAYPLFEKILARSKVSSAQNSLRYCLSFPSVSTVIPGMLTVRHVIENARASSFPRVSAVQLSKIHQIYKDHLFFNQM
jgi:aryl-alcohol dehydrogenase-like predicted oxidoreductase